MERSLKGTSGPITVSSSTTQSQRSSRHGSTDGTYARLDDGSLAKGNLHSSLLTVDIGPGDPTARHLLSFAEAENLFAHFCEYHVAQFPIVFFADNRASAQIQAKLPTLFLAVITAASGSFSPVLFQKLNIELLQEFAHKIMISSHKGLELVQAMLVMAAWYFPPDRFEDLKHFQYIYMAATMAVDIGLSDENGSQSPVSGTQDDHMYRPGQRPVVENLDKIEKHRTLLACYLLCAG
jgi:hypothetical protein